MSNRTYAAHDAALKALGKEQYRALLEATLAWHIGREPAAAADDPGHAPYLSGEVNGLCMALRLLGGYEGIAFDGEWALTVPEASFAWRRFLGYREGGAPAGAKTPRAAETWRELPGTRSREFPPSAERLRGGAIGAPRSSKERVLPESGD